MPYFYGTPNAIKHCMTWVKADLRDNTNDRVENVQAQFDMTKPEAIAFLVREGLENTNE